TKGFLLFTSVGIKTARDIWALPFPIGPTGGEPKPIALVNGMQNQRYPRVSPDGRWLAYSSSESGTQELYVRRFAPGDVANSGPKLEVSKGGARWPSWRQDSKALYYIGLPYQMMTVDLDTSTGFPQ